MSGMFSVQTALVYNRVHTNEIHEKCSGRIHERIFFGRQSQIKFHNNAKVSLSIEKSIRFEHFCAEQKKD